MAKSNFKHDAAHIRIYQAVYDSPAFKALSPHDVLAYLALLRELKGYNNGDLSLPLTRAKSCGIHHHVTLARSLRALCAVGLVAVTRKGGCTKGGQRLATLYRVTDRECFDIPKKLLEARPVTNEWKKFITIEAALMAIQAAEAAVKKEPAEKKSLGHLMTAIMSFGVLVEPKIRSRCVPWIQGLGHHMTIARNPAKPLSMRITSRFSLRSRNPIHRTPRVPPLYVYHSIEQKA